MFYSKGFALLCFCLLASFAMTAVASPAYITAKPRELTEAYGKKISDAVFSDNLSVLRQQSVAKATRVSPGLKCASSPQFILYDLYPVKVEKYKVAWIERYSVKCNRNVRRSLLMVLDGSNVKAISMIPGNTLADHVLQTDAARIVRTTISARHAKDCKSVAVVETDVPVRPSRQDTEWREVWAVYVCGKFYQAKVVFTLTQTGTRITVKDSGPLG